MAAEPEYGERLVQRLVEGEIWDQILERFVEVDSPAVTWAGMRSMVERTGLVDSEAFVDVLDVERALDKLRRHTPGCARHALTHGRCTCSHPMAALAILAALHGWEPDECKAVFAKMHLSYETAVRKGEAYMAAYLSGEDPDEAYGRGRR